MIQALENKIIVTGHYGSGKTNLSVNLALELRRQRKKTVLVDLDIVNPYFRSADFRSLAEEHGIELVTPAFAGSNLDVPALTGALDAWLGQDAALVVDVGGDDAGAFALGRYAARFRQGPYSMLYVVNCFRYLTREPEEALVLLREIETASRLRATHVVNNSNLSAETTPEDVKTSLDYAAGVSALSGLPLLGTAVRRDLYETMPDQTGLYPVEVVVKAPWM